MFILVNTCKIQCHTITKLSQLKKKNIVTSEKQMHENLKNNSTIKRVTQIFRENKTHLISFGNRL